MTKDKILQILNNQSLNQADKLIEIHKLATAPDADSYEIPGLGTVTTTKTARGNSIVIDGSKVSGAEWTDTPRLMVETDIYYNCGCTWGTDLDGKRFWKLFDWYDRMEQGQKGWNRHTDPVRKELYRFEEVYNFEEWLKRKVITILSEIQA